MMGLQSEVQAIQNPALGATLVWRAACGYCPPNSPASGMPLQIAFLVLPIVLHTRTREEVSATQAVSGVRRFEQKFKGKGDLLLALNRRALSMRRLSLRSIRLGLATGLLTLLPDRAVLFPRTYTVPANAGKPVEPLLKASEKFGAWCAPITLFELSGILRVEF